MGKALGDFLWMVTGQFFVCLLKTVPYILNWFLIKCVQNCTFNLMSISKVFYGLQQWSRLSVSLKTWWAIFEKASLGTSTLYIQLSFRMTASSPLSIEQDLESDITRQRTDGHSVRLLSFTACHLAQHPEPNISTMVPFWAVMPEFYFVSLRWAASSSKNGNKDWWKVSIVF